MAELTITVAVTTGTQYVTGSTGSIYTFDGSQPASFTFPWVASGTVRLDQSEATNDGHPLIFSTSNSTTLSTMQAGIISSGVTYYLDGASNQSDYTDTTTFNAATTRYIEIQPSSETDFYFACWVHGIGMGGIMDMTQDTWGALSWSQGKWSEQNDSSVALTGVSATSSLGSVTAFNEVGWGSDAWGVEDWGESGLTVTPTGLSLTSSLGTFDYAQSTSGWGRAEYGNAGWGVTYSVALSGLGLTSAFTAPEIQTLQLLTAPSTLTSSLGTLITAIVVPVTAPSTLTSSVGSPTYVGTNAGWGRDTWGAEPWNDSEDPVITLTGISATASVGEPSAYNEQGWGRDPWGYENWGESAMTVIVDVSSSGVATTGVGAISPTEMAVGLSGQSLTSSLGTPGLLFGPGDLALSGVSATVSVGAIAPADVMGITGVGATSAVGAITPTEMSIGLSGLSTTASEGEIVVTETAIIIPTGVSSTVSVGAISPTEMSVGLSGLSATSGVGAITPTQMIAGLTGVAATVSIGAVGGPIAWKKVTPTQGGSWAKVSPPE